MKIGLFLQVGVALVTDVIVIAKFSDIDPIVNRFAFTAHRQSNAGADGV
jgi:hypothetical protein